MIEITRDIPKIYERVAVEEFYKGLNIPVNVLSTLPTTSDAILGNDAGGKENSPADDAINGNGTGVPGDGVAATDEDDEDPALVNITQTFDLALIKKVKDGQKLIFDNGDLVTFVISVLNQGF